MLLAQNGGMETPDSLRLREQKRIERQFKIERYKNKRRNWIRKISYDCRKRVADARLRVKGRFISKKDCEKLKPNGFDDSSIAAEEAGFTNGENSALAGKESLKKEEQSSAEKYLFKSSLILTAASDLPESARAFAAAATSSKETMLRVRHRIAKKMPLFTLQKIKGATHAN